MDHLTLKIKITKAIKGKCISDLSTKDAVESVMEILAREFLPVLEEAKKTIKTWHNQGMSEKAGEAIWEIYEKRAPEMEKINELIDILKKHKIYENG